MGNHAVQSDAPPHGLWGGALRRLPERSRWSVRRAKASGARVAAAIATVTRIGTDAVKEHRVAMIPVERCRSIAGSRLSLPGRLPALSFRGKQARTM